MTSEELRKILKSRRGLQTAVSEATGIAYTTINSFVSGQSKQLRQDTMMKIIGALETLKLTRPSLQETPREFENADTLNVEISKQDLTDAAKFGLNAAEIAQRAVEEKVKEARLRAWVEENRSAFNIHAKEVEENGLWSDGLRQF